MLIVWRSEKPKLLGSTLSGIGASILGGRWNPQRIKCVYTASSKLLAVIETLGGYKNENRFDISDLLFVPIFIPSKVSRIVLDKTDLPDRWDDDLIDYPNHPTETQLLGENWYNNGNSCILIVPSKFLPRESVYLINPNHNDFTRIAIGQPEPLNYIANGIKDLLEMTKYKQIFICHASEDKEGIARPLYNYLFDEGISCWFDEAEISWGDSITEKVNAGLKDSKYVIVVLTKNFLSKPWPRREMMAALNKESSTGEKVVLPLISGTQEEKQEIINEFYLQNDKLYLEWKGQEDLKTVCDSLRRFLDN